MTKFVRAYIMPVKLGIHYRRPTVSARICARGVPRTKPPNCRITGDWRSIWTPLWFGGVTVVFP